MTKPGQEQTSSATSGVTGEVQVLDLAKILEVLDQADINLLGSLPWGSNYIFLVAMNSGEFTFPAVYKPCSGERPLWDFPDGTLCQRELASYLLSLALGWPLIPPTVLRDGPFGPGTVQFYIEADPDNHYYTLRNDEQYQTDFQQIAIFDFIINNADRKSGHCLKDNQGRIWAIDHGLAFHPDSKLRTVIWNYGERRLPQFMVADLKMLQAKLCDRVPPLDILVQLLTSTEVSALQGRIDHLINRGLFPIPKSGRHIPFPPI
jgi:uncharacterized repeat protein (TIGR03843 family)